MIGWTLCSGIGTPEKACPSIDWRLACESDAYAQTVLRERLNPGVLWPDMLTLDAAAADVPLPDIIVAGTPCQSFSISGLQRGLNDPRGNLTLHFVEIIRDIIAAREDHSLTVVWENVPGVLSDKTNAFGCFLGGLVGASRPLEPTLLKGRTRPSWPRAGAVDGPIGRVAWRTLDAQHFGVPQRRSRVFVVAGFGDGADPASVLFERKGGYGHPPSSRQTEENPVTSIADRSLIRGSGILSHNPGVTLTARDYKGPLPKADLSTIVAFCSKDSGQDAGALSPTLRASGHMTSRANAGAPPAVAYKAGEHWEVRRLTPTENERLQDFPDGWTAVPWRGRADTDPPDGHRYKTLGNAMAMPVIRWILERVLEDQNDRL